MLDSQAGSDVAGQPVLAARADTPLALPPFASPALETTCTMAARRAAHLVGAHGSPQRRDAAFLDVDVIDEIDSPTVRRPIPASDGDELADHGGLHALKDDAGELLEDTCSLLEHGAPAATDAPARQRGGRRPTDVLVEDVRQCSQVPAQPGAVELVDGLACPHARCAIPTKPRGDASWRRGRDHRFERAATPVVAIPGQLTGLRRPARATWQPRYQLAMSWSTRRSRKGPSVAA